ncbi:MAG: radical SAM family heme chaperone HemW [Planctomycetaceae bacterium]
MESGKAWPSAVYLHVPFCMHRCGYCDFTLVANRDRLIPDYLHCLRKELEFECRDVPRPWPVRTIFFGGGTPTHLPANHLETLLLLLREYFVLEAEGEFSVEANPDGLDDDRLKVLHEFGVNRMSLGVQSFVDAELKTLERTHRSAEARDVIHRVAERFGNTGADLIFGVPGQTLSSWNDSLQAALDLPVKHVSTYGLTFEPGTAFFRRRKSGDLRTTPEETEREMYLQAIRVLKQDRFQHYEVSNFAVPGFECQHNLVYWHAEEYFAFGPGAARYVHGRRTTNARRVTQWLKTWNLGEPGYEEDERLNDEDKAREAIMLALRLRSGLHIGSFQKRFGVNLDELCGAAIRRAVESGFAERSGDHLALTEDGLMIADSVISEFLG